MKFIGFIFLFTYCSNLIFGQSCGTYEIRFTGNIDNQSNEKISIGFPSVSYLEGHLREGQNNSFIFKEIKSKNFQVQIISKLTAPQIEVKKLLELYKNKHEHLKLLVILGDGNLAKTKVVYIGWENIIVTLNKENKYRPVFEFNINNIKI